MNEAVRKMLSIGVGTGARGLIHHVAVAVFVFWAGVCFATADYSRGLLDVATVLEAAAEVTPEKYPDADYVLVDDHILVKYRADGCSVTWDDTFIKVLTEKGRRENETLSAGFTLPYGTATYTLVHVIKPDGNTVEIDVEKQSRVMIDPSQMGSNIYNPNSKVLRVGVPGLEIGDMVRYVLHREVVKPRVPETWSDYQVFEYTSPIRRLVYEVLAPKELPLRSVALKAEVPGTVKHTQETQGEHIRYLWEVSDVPRMFPEPSMPAIYTVVQRLLVSTIPDWEYISKWYWNLCLPRMEPTAGMRAKVEELTEGLTDREARLRAVFRFVSQEIRYMGITVEEEAPGYEPHDVRMTFENRHGVCRDKSALLVSMLRLAGFEAFPVIIHNGPKKDPEVPQPFFNHAVSAVRNDDGSYTLMDSTDENTKELFPAYLCNQSYLVATPEGDTLRTSPIVAAEENLMHITTVARIDATGKLTGTSELRFEGINDNVYRGYFSRITPVERQQFFEGALKAFAPGARLDRIDIQPADMMDTSQRLHIQLEYSAEDILIADDTTVMLPVPRLGTRVGMVNFILGRTGLDERRYPLKTDIACGVRETLDLALAPALGKVELLPEYPVIDSDTLLWKRELRETPGGMAGKSEFLIKAVEFDPEQYLALKEALKLIEVNARKKPILQRPEAPPAGDADVEIIEDLWEYVLEDNANWSVQRRVRKRVLTYKGMKDYSERKWDYNPVWGEVELKRATVTNGDTVQKISEQEINLMDAGWVASAPRYPAAKTLVAAFPGVEVGSVIEYEVHWTYKDRPFFSMRHSFRGFDPVRSRTVRLSAPRSLRLKIAKWDGGTLGFGITAGEEVINETRRIAGDRVLYEWRASDQSGVKRERQLPPSWSIHPTVMVSGGNWRDYARHVERALRDAAAQGTEAVADIAASILPPQASDRDMVIAVRDYVAKQLRSAGPGLDDLPLTTLTPPVQTHAEGYGTSADRAVLLFALLRAAGLRPEFVLASSSPREPRLQEPGKRFPRTGLFPSVLVGLRIDGETVYLNDTHQYAALGATAHHEHLGLRLGKRRIETIRASTDMADRSDVQYDVRVEANGNATITRTVRYYGTAFAGGHKKFAEITPENRRRYYLETVAGISQAAKARGDLHTDFTRYPGIEQFSVDVADYAIVSGDYLYFHLPGTFGHLLGLRADKRDSPLYWSAPNRRTISTTLVLPEQYRDIVLMPEPIRWEAPEGIGTVSVTHGAEQTPDGAGAALRIVHQAALEPAVLPAECYAELLDIERQLSHPRNRTVLLRKAPSQ